MIDTTDDVQVPRVFLTWRGPAGFTKDEAALDALAAILGEGKSSRLYKRLAEFSFFQERRWYEKVARQPYSWLTACSEAFAAAASKRLGRRIPPHEVLFDAPPVKREIEFNVQIHFPKEHCFRPLGEVSPVVHTLATKQFDDYVKRVRIFVHPGIAADMRALPRMDEILAETLLTMG